MEKVLAASEGNGDTLSVWHSSLAHADRDAIRKMRQNNEVRGKDMTIPLAANTCSSGDEGTMPNTSIKSRAYPLTLAGASIHTRVAEGNVKSIGRAKYFVPFIGEASAPLGACHMKAKVEAAEF